MVKKVKEEIKVIRERLEIEVHRGQKERPEIEERMEKMEKMERKVRKEIREIKE